MKKWVFLMMAVVACCVSAAEYAYMPLVQEGKVWVYKSKTGANLSDSICMMEFRGDTVINDTTFKKLYFYDTKTLASPKWPLAYMCEIDKKVYARLNDAMYSVVTDSPYNSFTVAHTYETTTLLYDFNDIASQQFMGLPTGITPTITQVEIDGYLRNMGVWKSDDKRNIELIEGIGPNYPGMTLLKPSILDKWVSGKSDVVGLKYVADSEGNIIFKGCAYTAGGGTTGVTEISTASVGDSNVYTIDGRIVKSNAKNLDGLDKGIYIFKGEKMVVK